MEQTQLIEYFDKSEKNQQLLRLFESKWNIVQKVRETYNKNKITNPDTNEKLNLVFHSSCIPQNYENMKYKILVIGKNTNGWEFKKEAKKSMLSTLNFLNSTQHNDKLSFNFPYKFCKSINNYNYQNIIKKTYFTWVSLRKFVFNEIHKLPLNKETQDIIDNEFNILEEEIKIISPDIVLFLTGPNYDYYIQKQLNGVEFKEVANYQMGQFARVEHEILPKNSFRIYQPDYFRFIKKGIYDEYLEKLKKECGL